MFSVYGLYDGQEGEKKNFRSYSNCSEEKLVSNGFGFMVLIRQSARKVFSPSQGSSALQIVDNCIIGGDAWWDI